MAPKPDPKPVLLRDPAQTGHNPYVLVNDYPKRWVKEYIGKQFIKHHGSNHCRVGDAFLGRIDLRNRGMLSIDQDTRALTGREAYAEALTDFNESDLKREVLGIVNIAAFDPLDWSLPEWFTMDSGSVKSENGSSTARGFRRFINTTTTPVEDFHIMMDAITRRDGKEECDMPLGFLATPGSDFGLPVSFNRIPGQTLTRFNDYWDSYGKIRSDPERDLRQIYFGDLNEDEFLGDDLQYNIARPMKIARFR